MYKNGRLKPKAGRKVPPQLAPLSHKRDNKWRTPYPGRITRDLN